MEPRMNVIKAYPAGYQGMLGLGKAVADSELPTTTLELIKLRASQINGCGLCVDMHAYDAKQQGETDERLWSVAAWREAPYFTDAERAALALTEAATRLSERPEGVPDDVWQDAAKHFPEDQLAALVYAIAMINAWNRINVTIRQVAGAYRR
ncbi:AhpD family alkylhydroperoxidase [Tamaricihabitans halophyticus]|uniref:AhpD family alkylhydroperoxidase n=1 Tax=Tamaricihabitans halophyticus TaxID=1262583 RepID=A0A4R2QXJ4_9PSEU|nr:carboxymuconolactone decarboxylase family protein [Tamaricihabitans halophyticus]TCP54054.1 AhpD family alkylhydroperoxidase [Tamaricihabitans halophyticus]